MPSIEEFKKTFFDRDRVLSSMDRALQKNMSKFGAYVRTRSKSSIRRKKKASKPGMPPRNVTGKLKNYIFFGYDRQKKEVIIGPAGFQDKPLMAPELLEKGGTVVRPRSKNSKKKGMVVYNYGGNPYMQPAFDVERPKFIGMMKDSMK